MKKHLSVFMLAARFVFWPTVIVSLLGAAGTFAMFCIRSGGESVYTLTESLYSSLIWPVYIGVGVLFILLTLTMRERGGVQPGYTLRRLGVGELTVFTWQTVASALAFFVFMMFQAAVCLAYGLWLQNRGLGAAGDLSLLVAFVNGTFTHAMLPLGDALVYVRMLCVYFTLGTAAAYGSFMGRHGKTAISPFVALAAALLLWALQAQVIDAGYNLTAIIACAVVCLCFFLSARSHRRDDEDEAAPQGIGGESVGQS